MNQSINESNLNDEQFEQLQKMYVHTIVESMNVEELEQYVLNDMEDFCNKLTLNELIEEVKYTIDEEFLDEMITTIKQKIKD